MCVVLSRQDSKSATCESASADIEDTSNESTFTMKMLYTCYILQLERELLVILEFGWICILV